MRMTEAAAVAVAPASDVEARNALVVEHLGLVKSIARRLAQRVPAQVDVNDLISVGMVGLIDAAGRYRPSVGAPFEAYARQRIHGAMLDSLRQLDDVPRSVRRMRRHVDQAILTLRHELNREPSDAEIAARLNVSEREYDEMLDHMRGADVGTVRRVDRADGDRSVLDFAIDPEDGPQVRLERAEMKQHLAYAITELPERERQILTLYYQEELTLAEIGAVIGVGESRVSQLRTQAIARIRARLRETLRLTSMR
jgi:RNA polymerase sigma factor for flagellar operon FliA